MQLNYKNRTAQIVLLASVSLMASNSFSQAAGFEILKPHRAVYEIKLKNSTERSGISNMNGRIVYELSGNECEGISVSYRFVSKINAHGEIFTTDQQTASYESADGLEYSFLTKSFVNDVHDRTVKGSAILEQDNVKVSLKSPEERELSLNGASFVSTHLVEVLQKAKEGTPFFKVNVFDGGDEADKILKTTNIIGKANVVSEIFPGEKDAAVSSLIDKEGWPVTIGYFDNSISNASEELPIYEVSFLLYEGGISRKLVMNYPDYSLTGTLIDLELLDVDICQENN